MTRKIAVTLSFDKRVTGVTRGNRSAGNRGNRSAAVRKMIREGAKEKELEVEKAKGAE
jgi:hypothetical protein